jgi:hypothetical protein
MYDRYTVPLKNSNLEGIFQKWVVSQYRSFTHGWKGQDLGSMKMNADVWNTAQGTLLSLSFSRGKVRQDEKFFAIR